LQKSSKVAKVW